MADFGSEMIPILERGAGALGLILTTRQLDQYVRYAEMLAEWNATRMNLTRLTTPLDIAVKHFLDSLVLLRAVTLPPEARVIDVGTGAGFPGLALKIARPDLKVTLLDSTAKKLSFCRAVIEDLRLDAVSSVHARAEEASRRQEHAGAYDIVAARAVAPLDKLLPWCAPFACPGGRIVALKGALAADEAAAARPVAARLRLSLAQPIPVLLPEALEDTVRYVVIAVRRD